MAIKIRLAPILQQFTENREIVEVNGNTVDECLVDLAKMYPDMQKWVYGDCSLPVVWVLLNEEILLPQNLDKPVTSEDEICLIPMIAGG